MPEFSKHLSVLSTILDAIIINPARKLPCSDCLPCSAAIYVMGRSCKRSRSSRKRSSSYNGLLLLFIFKWQSATDSQCPSRIGHLPKYRPLDFIAWTIAAIISGLSVRSKKMALHSPLGIELAIGLVRLASNCTCESIKAPTSGICPVFGHSSQDRC